MAENGVRDCLLKMGELFSKLGRVVFFRQNSGSFRPHHVRRVVFVGSCL